jgi:uncharacterized RDD family membrane protein YckC
MGAEDTLTTEATGHIVDTGSHIRQWYYVEEGQQRGPIAEADFVKLFESGQLGPDTMVWTEGLEQWAISRDVDGLIPSAYKPPPAPLPTSPRASAALAVEYAPSGNQIRPWVRYWARMLDFFLFCFLAGIVLAFVDAPALDMPDALFGIVLLFAYVFVEPAMLAGWGTTPGKALLKVRLRNSDGNKLSYAQALSRAFKVCFRGEGLGIPIIALFTHIHAYNRLTKQGVTSWDEDEDFKVSHQTIGAWRTIVAVVIMLGMFFLMAIGNTDI